MLENSLHSTAVCFYLIFHSKLVRIIFLFCTSATDNAQEKLQAKELDLS